MPLTVGVLMALPCRSSADGNSYLWAVPWIQCTSSNSTWVQLVATGSILAVIIGLGVPALFFFLMRRRTRELRELGVSPATEAEGHWFQWFYGASQAESLWYEFVIMGRRLAIAIIAFLPATSPWVPIAFFITLMAGLLFQIHASPFIFVPLFLTFVAGQVFSSKIHEDEIASSSILLELF